MTKEEKLKDIEKARECFDEAHRLIEEGKRLIKRGLRDVFICDMSDDCKPMDGMSVKCRDYYGMVEVHLYRGINRLAKALDMKPEPYRDYENKVDHTRKSLCIGGIEFFQIGEPIQSKYCYK